MPKCARWIITYCEIKLGWENLGVILYIIGTVFRSSIYTFKYFLKWRINWKSKKKKRKSIKRNLWRCVVLYLNLILWEFSYYVLKFGIRLFCFYYRGYVHNIKCITVTIFNELFIPYSHSVVQPSLLYSSRILQHPSRSSVAKIPHFLLPPIPSNLTSTSCLCGFLDISYKWNHTVPGLLCLPSVNLYQNFISFYCWIIFHCMDISHFV